MQYIRQSCASFMFFVLQVFCTPFAYEIVVSAPDHIHVYERVYAINIASYWSGNETNEVVSEPISYE